MIGDWHVVCTNEYCSYDEILTGDEYDISSDSQCPKCDKWCSLVLRREK